MEASQIYNNKTKELSSGGKASFCPPGGIGKVLFDNIKKHAENNLTAQIDGQTEKDESYQAFLSKSIKIALYLKDQGLQPGDIISMCSENNMHNMAVLVASLFTGIIIASTDPVISLEDTKHLLALVEPKLIFVCEKSLNLILKATGENRNCKIITLFRHDYLDSVPNILDNYTFSAVEGIESFQPFYVDDTKTNAIILFSSGTTGLPKGICLSHEFLHSDLRRLDFPYGARVCGFSTLYWHSSIFFALTTLSTGLVTVKFREFSAKELWQNLHRLKISVLHMSYSTGMEGIQYLNLPMPHLKLLVITGGQLSTICYNAYKQKLPEMQLLCTYGMSEVGGISSHLGNCSPDSVGFIFPKDIVVRIVDPKTEAAVDINVIGEIRVKGPQQMNGYYKQDSSDCWDDKGFFKTGDFGYFNDNYHLFVVDRIKEMFKYRSWHVVPAKIEKVLKEHPAVLHAIVLGLPTTDNENHAMGIVVLRDENSASEEELLKLVNDRMDDIHQIRAGIKFISESEIPYTATGKINRRMLKQMFLTRN